MISEIKNFGMKKWILILLSLLFITDLVVIINIPFLREIMVFISFTSLPGILIIHCLRLKQIDFLKKLVLSVGLSISFILFTGMVLNSLYPLLQKPLSLIPVLVLFNLILIIMAFIAYKRNRDDFILDDFLNIKIDYDGQLTSMLIFPLFFPFMAILGTNLMNNTGNNLILIVMLFLILFYMILLGILRKKVHNITYPLALWSIGLSILLMYGLTSSHIMGRDVNNEFYCFMLTLSNSHWNIMNYYNPYNACLSITILPVIYQVLSAMNPEYIFKLFAAVIGSFIPLVVYIVAKKYVALRYAFFASLLFVFQLFFFNLLGAIRQEIAILFFFLAFMIIFSSDIDRRSKKVLFLIFMFSLIVSHYTTAYVAFVLVVPILVLPFLKGLFKDRKLVFTNFDIILLSLIFIAIWYIMYAHIQVNAGTQVVQTTIAASTTSNASSFASSKGDFVLGVLGIKLKSVPNFMSVIAHDLIFVTILIGLFAIVRRFNYYHIKFGTEFLLGIGLSLTLLVMFVMLPYISIAYDASRLFFQVLIFLAPVFIIGCIAFAKLIKKPKWDLVVILVLLISLFMCTSYLQYHFYGSPYSATIDKDGVIRGEYYVYDSELTGTYWLKNNRLNNLTIYSDGRENSRFNLADLRGSNINSTFFQWNKTVNSGYIYLGYLNIKKKEVLEIFNDISMSDMKNYFNILKGKDVIYDSGGSQIWI